MFFAFGAPVDMGIRNFDLRRFRFVFHIGAILHGVAVENTAAFVIAEADGRPLRLVVACLDNRLAAVFAGLGNGFDWHGGYIGQVGTKGKCVPDRAVSMRKGAPLGAPPHL